MTNYQITIGYKAVVSVEVKAENEKEAQQKAVAIFGKQKDKIFNKNGVKIQEDNFKADGCLDLDRTWNMYDK